jgi:hypothetical protein
MVSAVKRLAGLHTTRSTKLLQDLAVNPGPFDINGGVQMAAIQVLTDRKDPDAAPALAALLQPTEAQPIRKAVSDALQRLSCPETCIAPILHYLECIFHGEKNVESARLSKEMFQGLAGFEAEVRASIVRDETAVYDGLYIVLQQNSRATVHALVTTYGLGTGLPSTFALNLLSRIKTAEACPWLWQSQRTNDNSAATKRGDVETAISAVRCKDQTAPSVPTTH